MEEHLLSGKMISNGACGTERFFCSAFGCGRARPIKRSRAILKHGGGAPIPPLLGYENGIVWEKSVCGGHIMEEHLLSGKVIVGGACGTDRLYCSANRVQCALCRNKHESTGKLAVGGVCNADRFHISINRYGASSAGGAAHSMRR